MADQRCSAPGCSCPLSVVRKGGGRTSVRFARRLSSAAPSWVPGVMLVFLPKCPLCIAAWLTAVTGIGCSAAAAASLREILVIFCLAAIALVAGRIIWRRAWAGQARSETLGRTHFRLLSSDTMASQRGTAP